MLVFIDKEPTTYNLGSQMFLSENHTFRVSLNLNSISLLPKDLANGKMSCGLNSTFECVKEKLESIHLEPFEDGNYTR